MGSLFGGGGSTTTQSSGDPVKQEAFNIAKPYYQQGLTGASNLYNQTNAQPAYMGPRVAGLNPYQTSAGNYLGGFANQFTPLATNAAGNLGLSNIAPAMSVGMNAADIFGRSSMDPTQQIIAAAGQYANNPYVDKLIDATGRDIGRNLFERELPGINRAATGAGNLNSTRAGVEAAIAQRGAADRFADMSSNIRSQFFGQGLSDARNQFNQNLQNMLAANQGLLGSGQFGLEAMGGAQGLASTGAGQGISAGDLFRSYEQAGLDANKAVFDESLANRLATINALLGGTSVGAGFGGGPTSSTQTTSGGGSLGGTLLGAGSFLSGLKSAGGLSGIGSLLSFSDSRMKHNLKPLNKLSSGLQVYRFEYKPQFKDIAGHGTFVGVLADDVEKVIPEAVRVALNGYKMVDYSKVR